VPAPRPERRPARRFKRRTVRVLVDYVSDAGVRCEYATTLGAGGLFVATEQPLAVGARLVLRFRLPGSDVLHTVEGRVAWRQAPDEAATPARAPGMGVAFVDAAATAVLARELEGLDAAEPERSEA
jgi:uncharacterized protein (TIGR02266 family)